jgi:pimeloyl-ACP methyl ester carboxylesterase
MGRRGEPPLLFAVAAILTSVALGPAAEAFDVPKSSQVAASIPWAAGIANGAEPTGGDSGVPFIGPTPYFGPDLGPQPGPGPELTSTNLSGIQLLQQLSVLTPSQIREILAARPDAISDLLANPPAARDVTVWWETLSPAVQTRLRLVSPELIGNLDGLPFAARDGANREYLEQTLRHLRGVTASDAGRTVIDQAEQQLQMLGAIADSLESSGGPERTLLSLDVTGQGRAAIVVGNLGTADYVSYLVPGMFFTIENQMGDWTNAAVELYAEQTSWLSMFAAKDGAKAGAAPAPTSTVATIAWIGYHTPNLTNVGALDNAIEGRDSLASAVEGLQAVRGSDQPFVTVVAHSYGSTAALMALTEDTFQIDALAMVGSPGSDAQSVEALHVDDANVWVGEAAWDPVPNSSFFGSDPGSPAYGARKMGVDGGIDPITHERLTASIGHNEYFGAGSQSMRNLALIAIDRGEFVSDGSSADAGKTLDLLR